MSELALTTLTIVLAKLGYLIDNPWSNAMDRAKAAGLVLADVLIERHVGVRPTSLVGFSLGARVIFYALTELARRGAYGIVQDVYLFGATLTANRQTWLEVRSVVGGRFVNGFSTNDWMLGYLLRAATGGLQTVAGLRPVETIPGLENVDVTDLIHGHMSYRTVMPQLLARVGFPVTSDYFDEPDVSVSSQFNANWQDPDLDPDVQERYVVNEEEAAEEEEKKQKKLLGLFPRKGKGSRNNSGRSTPARMSGDTHGSPSEKRRTGADDDDELPPREEEVEADIGDMPKSSSPVDEEAAVQHIPKTAGFDFDAIGKVLGKDIDVDKLQHERPDVRPTSPLKAPERTESAPPPAPASPSPSERRPISPPARSQSAAHNSTAFQGLAVEDDGDIAITAQKNASTEMPSWDRPAWPVETSQSRSPASNSKAPSIFGFNAWSSPASGSYNETGVRTAAPMRAAPPARPHPPELMANPFANPFASNGEGDVGRGSSGAGAGTSASGQKRTAWEERMALENPW